MMNFDSLDRISFVVAFVLRLRGVVADILGRVRTSRKRHAFVLAGLLLGNGAFAQMSPFPLPPPPYPVRPAPAQPVWPTNPNQTQPPAISPQPGGPAQFGGPQQPIPGSQPFPAQQLGMPPAQGNAPVQLPLSGNLKQEPTSKRFANLPTVTIREFRSSVPEITARAATDMFMTALVKTRKFRVLERARMTEGISQEKALNQQGMTTGQAGDVKYVAAKYMFEATISELLIGENGTRLGLNIMGLGGGKSYTTDTIGIDVRVTEVESGVVADAIDIRKPIYGESTTISGVEDGLANLISRGRVQSIGGSGSPNYESRRKDSLDKVLRECIEEAISQIAARFADE